MSVINRMLADLERRGAPAARASGAAVSAHRRRRRPRAWLRYAPPLVLALALVAVAVALWHQRAPDMLGPMLADQADEPAPAAVETATPAPPRLTRIGFAADGEHGAVLRLELARAPAGAPQYSRDGTRLALRLPARADGVAVPAPPGGQAVFRELRLEPRNDTARLTLAVHPDARFDVARVDSGFELRGRLPAEPPAATDNAAAGGDAAETHAAADADGSETDPGAQVTATTDADGDAAATTTAAAGDNGRDADEAAAADDVATADAAAAGDGGGATAGAETRDRDADEAAAAEDVATADAAAAGDGGGATAAAGDNGRGAEEEGAGDDGATAATAAAETGDGGADGGAAATGDGSKARASVRKTGGSTPAVRATRRYRQAREALADGEHVTARGHLRRALELDPGLHPARELLVALLRRTGDDAAARNLLADGVERAPSRAAFAKPYARLLVDAGDLQRAADVLERAAPGAGDDAGYHALQAAIEQRLGRHGRAVEAYTRALELDGSHGRWWLGLGISLAAADYPAEARAAFREARATGDLDERLDTWARDRIDALARAGQG